MVKYYFFAALIVLTILLLFLFYPAIKRWVKKSKWPIRISGIYKVLSMLPILGGHISTINRKLFNTNPEDETTIRFKAVSYFLISVMTSLVSLITLIMIYDKDVFMTAILIFLSYVIYNAVLDLLIGDETKLLTEFLAFLNDVKHDYQLNRMVKESVQYATDKSTSRMNLHGKKILEALLNSESLNHYSLQTRNKHLKNFVNHVFIIQEYGDKKVENVSLFIKNINYIIADIKMELKKKNDLKYNLMFVLPITVFPLLLPRISKTWVLSNFPQTSFFYNGIWGKLAEVLMIIISLTCYATIRYLKNTYKSNIKIKNSSTWDRKLLSFKWVRTLIKVIQPKQTSKEYYKVHDLLQAAGSHFDFNGLYIRKLIYLISTFVLSITFLHAIHVTNALEILNNISQEYLSESLYITDLNGQIVDMNEIYKEAMTENVSEKRETNDSDRILGILKEKGVDVTRANVLEVATILNTKINQSLNNYYTETLQLKDFLIAFILSLLLMEIPTWILMFKKYVRKEDMEDEVFQFETIVLLLMHHESTSRKTILEWMERFADIFYNPIRLCNIQLQHNESDSLEYLKNNLKPIENSIITNENRALVSLQESVKYKAFFRLVDNLIAADKIGIRQAFESLESERNFFIDERKTSIERLINNRTILGEMVALVPFVYLVGAYLVLPILLAANMQFNMLTNLPTMF